MPNFDLPMSNFDSMLSNFDLMVPNFDLISEGSQRLAGGRAQRHPRIRIAHFEFDPGGVASVPPKGFTLFFTSNSPARLPACQIFWPVKSGDSGFPGRICPKRMEMKTRICWSPGDQTGHKTTEFPG